MDFERAQKRGLEQFWERWFRSDSGHYIAGFQSFVGVNDFERQFERNLRQWLRRRHTSEASWDINRQGSPYRGLVPYEEDHASLFFGRETDIARARATFIEAAIGHESGRRGTRLLILGASGAPERKSSFLRAGLVPRVRTARACPRFWRTAAMRSAPSGPLSLRLENWARICAWGWRTVCTDPPTRTLSGSAARCTSFLRVTTRQRRHSPRHRQ